MKKSDFRHYNIQATGNVKTFQLLPQLFKFHTITFSANMKNTLSALIFIFSLVTGGFGLQAQNAGVCNTPSVICNGPALTFSQNGQFGLGPGLGVSNPTTPPTGTNIGCMFSPYAPNPQWLLINITATGNLGFILGSNTSANPQNGFLHWIMWPYDPSTCAGIFGNTLPPAACNFNCSGSGGTGMSSGPFIAPMNQCNFTPTMAVTKGQQFLILVSNGCPTNTCAVSFSVLSGPSLPGAAQVSCNPFTVPNVTACPGQEVVSTSTWTGASATNYTILSPFGTQLPVFQTSPSFTISGMATGVFTVLASGQNGASLPITASENFTLTVVPTTTMSVSHYTNYCTNSCAVFTLAPGAGTFNVSGPGTPPMPIGTTANTLALCGLQSPNNNGVYNFTGTFVTGCVATISTQINVAPDNFINIINPINNTNSVVVCQGNPAQFQASMPTATGYTLVGPGCFSTAIPATMNGNTGSWILPSIPATCGGFGPSYIFTVTSNINFNGIECARSATMSIRVTRTYSVTVTPSFTFCEGTSACLNASAVGANANSYSWFGPLGYTSLNQNPCITNSITTAPNPNMAGNYMVTVTYDEGFGPCPSSANVDVQVVSVPAVQIAFASPICQYGTFTGFIGNAAQSYSWTGPQTPAFTSTNPAITIQNVGLQDGGNYSVTVVYAIGTRTCGASASKFLNVIPVESISVTPVAPICRPGGGNINLSANALGATSYFWAGPNTFTANGPSATVYYPTTNATGVYTIYTTFNNGFPCANTNTVFVSVNPFLPFSLPPIIRGCYNETVTVDGPVGATSYTWSSSAGLNNYYNKDLVLAAISPSQAGLYVLNVSLGPCVSSRSVQIEVLTPISFSLTELSVDICRGEKSRFEVGATGGSEVYAFDWNPSNYLSSPTGSLVTGKILGTTVFNVSARDVACPNFTISHSFTVKVRQPPMPDLRLQGTAGCQPLCVEFNPRTEATASITTYDLGGYLMQNDKPFNYCFPEPGSYKIKVYSLGINGCLDTLVVPDPIVVFPKAKAGIQFSPELPNTTDNLVTFNAISRDATIAYYSWMFAGTSYKTSYDTSNVRNPMRTYEETGKYPVMLISTTDNGCVDTTITFLEVKDDMNIFIPNTFTPNNDGVNDRFMVKGLGFKAESFFIEIFDRWGHSVYTSKDVTAGWDGSVKGQNPSEGVYIYKVRIIGANGEGRKEYIGNVTLLR